MSPNFATANGAHGLVGHPIETPCNDGVIGAMEYSRDFHLSEFRLGAPLAARFKAMANCMRHVVLRGDVFKIRHAVVLLLAILVIDLITRWAWANEGPGHEAMDSHRALNQWIDARQLRKSISLSRRPEFQQAAVAMAWPATAHHPIIRDLVSAFKACGNSRSPFGWHTRILSVIEAL